MAAQTDPFRYRSLPPHRHQRAGRTARPVVSGDGDRFLSRLPTGNVPCDGPEVNTYSGPYEKSQSIGSAYFLMGIKTGALAVVLTVQE